MGTGLFPFSSLDGKAFAYYNKPMRKRNDPIGREEGKAV